MSSQATAAMLAGVARLPACGAVEVFDVVSDVLGLGSISLVGTTCSLELDASLSET